MTTCDYIQDKTYCRLTQEECIANPEHPSWCRILEYYRKAVYSETGSTRDIHRRNHVREILNVGGVVEA